MAEEHHVAYVQTARDALARHITRLAGDDVQLDEIEQLLIALQRSGRLARVEMVKLQAVSARNQTVTFDPLGDFETQGYLRNLAREKDSEIVRHLAWSMRRS
jgi:phosphoglycolate phosphatase-like HAD superfamily hydrolase